jgi:hypothetical protein
MQLSRQRFLGVGIPSLTFLWNKSVVVPGTSQSQSRLEPDNYPFGGLELLILLALTDRGQSAPLQR